MSNQLAVIPSKWVKANVMFAMTGYTQDALEMKRKRGVWEEGVVWKKAPDGNILYNWRAYEEWVEKGFKAA